MKAVLIIRQRLNYTDGAILDIKVWEVPAPVPPSGHRFKYSLFYGRAGERIVGYDNERGKGDHRHLGPDELPYRFVDLDTLLDDFGHDVKRARGEA